MKIVMVGTGYVGLVTGACFADSGNDVFCVDIDPRKIETLRAGKIPIYEPGLEELVSGAVAAGRLKFTTDLGAAILASAPNDGESSSLIFLAVGTPQSSDGAADLSNLWKVVHDLAPHLHPRAVVVTKSTVPVGTNAEIHRRLKAALGREPRVASNPEFLREGVALRDFREPDRVVIGVRSEEDAAPFRELYRPFLKSEEHFLQMSPESAEMTKYVANAFLAAKLSFINEMANICQRVGADINEVREGIGLDFRIGRHFFAPGVGYGGSCFPKDVLALKKTATEVGVLPQMLTSIDEVNRRQKTILLPALIDEFSGKLTDHVVAVWGLAFKPDTDDIREASSLDMIDALLHRGAQVRAYDPVARENTERRFREHPYLEQLKFCTDPYEAAQGADALVLMTEWNEFARADLAKLKRLMRTPKVFDGRNIYSGTQMQSLGFVYHSIGRSPVR